MNQRGPRRAYPDVLPAATPSEPPGADAASALTEGDHGRLPEGTRRALVQLLRGP